MLDDTSAVSVDALVNGDHAQVLEMLARAPGTTSAVYWMSRHIHRDVPAWQRRQILALDAARFGDAALSAQITTTPVPDEPDAEWVVRWSTGALAEPRLRLTIDAARAPVSAVSPVVIGGRPHLVSGDQGEEGGRGAVRLWDAVTGEQVGAPMESGVDVWVTAVTALGIGGRPHAITGHSDGAVRTWELTPLPAGHRPSPGHRKMLNGLTTLDLGGRPHIVSGDSAGLVRTWDLETGAPGVALNTDGRPRAEIANSMFTLHDRAHLLTVGKGDKAASWDLTTGLPAGVPFSVAKRIRTAATVVIDRRPHAVFCASDGLHVRDLAPLGQAGAPIDDQAYWRSAVSVEIGGRPHLVTGELDGSLRVWDLVARRPVGAPLTGHEQSVRAIATTMLDGRPHAVTSGPDGTVRVWDLISQTQFGEPIAAHEQDVYTVAVGELGGRRVIATGSHDQTVRFWDLDTREQVGRDLRFTWAAFSLAITSDEQIVVGFGHEVAVLNATKAFDTTS